MNSNGFLKKIMQNVYLQRHSLPKTPKTVVRTERVDGGVLCEVWFMTAGCCHDMAGGCVMCNYGKGHLVQQDEIIGQLRTCFAELPAGLSELVINPSGSFLDNGEVSLDLRAAIMALLKEIPFDTLTVESRADVVTLNALKELRDTLPGKQICIEMGVESFHPWLLRNSINKGLTLETIFTAVSQIHSLEMRSIANIGLGMPFISESANIVQATASIHLAFKMGFDQVVLFPYHVKPGTLLKELYELKMYQCVSLWSLVRVLSSLNSDILRNTNISWYKNNYADKNKVISSPTTCINCEARVLNMLDDYRNNPSQFSVDQLVNIKCDCFENWAEARIREPQEIIFDDVAVVYRNLAKVFNVDDNLLETELTQMRFALEEYNVNY